MFQSIEEAKANYVEVCEDFHRKWFEIGERGRTRAKALGEEYDSFDHWTEEDRRTYDEFKKKLRYMAEALGMTNEEKDNTDEGVFCQVREEMKIF